MRKEKYKIYTDGACSGNPGPGGWAAIILQNSNEICLAGSNKKTTNNKMELKALIKALEYSNKLSKEKAIELEIFSDSKYIVDGINIWLNKWKKNNWKNSENKTIKNLKQWQYLDKLLFDKKYVIKWVKGHDKDKYNIKVDKLARSKIINNASVDSSRLKI